MQVPDWMPAWLKNHPAILNHNPIKEPKSFAGFQFSDFRANVAHHAPAVKLQAFFLFHCSAALKELYISSSQTARELEHFILALLEEVKQIDFWQSPRQTLRQSLSFKNRIVFPVNSSIIKVYRWLRFQLQQLTIQILPELETTLEFKQYSKRGNYTLVFSTDPIDLFGMSSRSYWKTCQTLTEDKRENRRVLGAGLHPNIGIVYLTHQKNYLNRGEEMLTRWLLRYLWDTKDQQFCLLLDPMYPYFDLSLANLILTELRFRTSLPIFHGELLYTQPAYYHRFQMPSKTSILLANYEAPFSDLEELFVTSNCGKIREKLL